MQRINFNELEIKESWCLKHNSLLNIKNFYKSKSPRYINNVQPLCKDCANKLCKEYLNETDSLETAIYYTCAFLDTPFVKKAYEKMQNLIDKKEKKDDIQYWTVYMQSYNRLTKKDLEKYQTFIDSDKIKSNILEGITNEQQKALNEIENLHKFWGKDLIVDDIEYLENKMYEYTKDIPNLSVYQESLYKDLCLTELQIYKKENVNEAFKQKQKIAEKLGIDSFESNKIVTFGEETIENQIFIMEEYEPAEYMENQELYKDFMGLGKKWILDILRPIKNLVTGSKDYNISSLDTKAFDDKVEELTKNE